MSNLDSATSSPVAINGKAGTRTTPRAKTKGPNEKSPGKSNTSSTGRKRKSSIPAESPLIKKKLRTQPTLDAFAGVTELPIANEPDQSISDDHGVEHEGTSTPTLETKTTEMDKNAKNEGSSEKKKERKKPGPKPKAQLPKPVVNLFHYPEDLPWLEDEDLTNVQPDDDEPLIENSPSVAILVLFLTQFREVLDGVPDIGPQDIELGVQVENGFSRDVEIYMCRLMSLMLNRKKMVEPGRYGRALEEVAIHAKTNGIGNFPPDVNLKNGIAHLPWEDKLEFLRLLTFWVLSSSEVVHAMLTNGTIPLVEPVKLGTDGNGDNYYLIKGNNTSFRVYRETNPRLRHVSWRSVAGTPVEVTKLIQQLLSSQNQDVKQENGKVKRKKSESATDSTNLFKSWTPSEQDRPVLINNLVERLSDELIRLKEDEEERVKEHHRERRKKQIEEEAAKARQGEGRYVGRTRGKKINYNVDDIYSEQISEEDEYEGLGDDYEEDAGEPSTRGSRRSARIRENLNVTPDIEDVQEDVEMYGETEEEPKSKVVVFKYSSPVNSSPPSEY